MGALSEFWAQLRQRNVVRTAVAYAAASWLVLQALDTAGDLVGFPDWTLRFVLTVLLIGFPFALVAAWIYELTPEGVRRDSGSTDTPRDPHVRRRLDLVIVALLVLALGVAGYDRLSGAPRGPIAAQVEKSIAVLPFTAFSTEQEEQFFADGLADTLLHRLAQLSDVKVIARSSSFQYRGSAVDVREVGRALGVATVLEGSVQRSGERLRVIAQLVRTDDGSHVWSRTFDRERSDLFEIQDQIATAVATSLSLSLSGNERDRLAATETTSLEAYELHVQARERFQQLPIFELSETELVHQLLPVHDLLDRALELDPSYADALTTRAGTYGLLAFRTNDAKRREAWIRVGEEQLQRAMLLVPDAPRGLTLFADFLRRGEDWGMAEVFYRNAIRAAPSDPDAHLGLGLVLLDTGQYEEARTHFARSEVLDPDRDGFDLYGRRRYLVQAALGEHQAALDTLLELIGQQSEQELLASDVYLHASYTMGRQVDAARSLLQILDAKGGTSGDLLRASFAGVLHGTGRLDEAVAVLQPESGVVAPFDRSRSLDSVDVFALGVAARGFAPGEPFFAALRCSARRDAPCLRDVLEPMFPALTIELGEVAVPSSALLSATRLALAYRALGDTVRAERLNRAIQRTAAALPADGAVHRRQWTRVGVLSLAGDTAGALEAFRSGIEMPGGAFRPILDLDDFVFDYIRSHPEFDGIVAEYERRRRIAGEEVVALFEEAGVL